MTLPTVVRELDARIWRTLDPTQPLSDDEESYVHSKLSIVTEVEGRGKCLPIKDTLELQDICQKCWNLTALKRWPEERLRLKALYRNLITHLYLIGNNFFAPLTVRNSYLANHPTEVEQCILMCLKTANNLSSERMGEAAKKLLEHATATSSCCSRRSGSRLDYLELEVLFARMHVLRQLKEYKVSAEAAARLCSGTQHHYRTYRESLLQYIFSVGEGPVEDADPKSDGKRSEPNGVGGAADEKQEEYIRHLLQLSIEIQGREELTLRRQQALYGATLLQLAASFMRSHLYSEALYYSEKAYEELQSLEPVLLQLKAHALLHNHEATTVLFEQILSNTEADFTLEEVFSLTALVLQSNPDLAETLTRILKQLVEVKVGSRPSVTHSSPTSPSPSPSPSASAPVSLSTPNDASSTRAEFHLRYVVLLLPLRTEWALREVCARVESLAETTEPSNALGPYARVYFCVLWGLREWEGVATGQRLRALRCALHFAESASEEELEGVLLDLALMTFDWFLQSKEKEGVLECYRLFVAHRHVLRSVHSFAYLAQLALVAVPEVEGGAVALRHLRELITYDRHGSIKMEVDAENMIAAACGSLVNFFHSLDDLPTASKIAEMVIAECSELTNEDRIDFLKVCALCILSNAVEPCDSPNTEVTLLTQHILRTLKKHPTISPSEYFWWCRFLFHISETISEVNVNLGVEIGCAAVELFQSKCDCSLEENRKMLRNRTIFILDREFDLFVCGIPALPVEDIASYISLVQESNNAEDNLTDMVTAFLSRIELGLRTLTSEASLEEVMATVDLEKLIVAGASHHDLEALASATTFVGHQSDNHAALQYSVTVQLSAAALYCKSLERASSSDPSAASQAACVACCTPDTFSCLLVMYYKAYQMATDAAQRERVLDAIKEKVLCNISPAQTIKEYLMQMSEDEETFNDVMGEKMETLFEYFTIEAWNRAVRFNAVHNREQMCLWRDLAATFSRTLSVENPARIAITDFLPRMPEM